MPTAKKTRFKPSLIFESRLELPGSFRKIPYGKNTGSTSLNELIEVMVKIRRKSPIQTFIRGLSTGKNQPVTPDVFDRRYGASMEDINLVIDFARLFDLTVLQTSVSRRCIILKG
jgi:hypothetical protein